MMKKRLWICLLAAGLGGCADMSHDQITAYRDAGVPAPVYARIQKHDRLAVSDVVDMSRSGVRSSAIIAYISSSNSTFALNDGDAAHLLAQGVSEDVVAYMREKR